MDDIETAARGTFDVLENGGRVELNIWGMTAADESRVVNAFRAAGFRTVRVNEFVGPGGTTVPAHGMVQAIK